MLASSTPTPFGLAFAEGAAPGYIRTIPDTTVTPGAASYTLGFPPICFVDPAAGGIPWSGEDVNGAFNALTLAAQWTQAGGMATYNAAFSTAIGGYPHGALLMAAAMTHLWLSTVDNNTSDPDTGGANWLSVAPTQIDLATQVQGVLPVANGGTGQSVATSSQLASINYSLGAGAATFIVNAQSVVLRSATLTTGAPNTRVIASPINMVVPSGATLGTTNAVASRIYYAVIDNAGTLEVAVNNATSASVLDEDELISTTAISGAANSANVWYSTTARSNVPYKVMGFFESTQTTAGTWAQTPTTVQPAGGLGVVQQVTNLQLFGSVNDVTGSRTAGTTYTNSTGKPMFVMISFANQWSILQTID